MDKQFDAKSKELGKAQEAVNSYNDEKARKAWDAFEEERRKTEENARKFSELRSSNIQLKRKNDEKERQNRGEKDAYDKMMGNYVTPLVAGMQYNAGTERDEREETVRKREEQQKQEAEKQKAKKEADKQAAEAERAKKEAEKQAAQAEQAKKAQETPPSKVQQQSAEAIRARKEAKTQQSQADDAALAEKHRAMVQNLMELGYSEEEAQAIVNKKTMQPKKPADSMTANNKPSIPEKKEEKDDNGISPNIAETMSGLSRGY